MSIFGNMMSKIFGHASAAPASAGGAAPPPTGAASTPSTAPASAGGTSSGGASAPAAPGGQGGGGSAQSGKQDVDVAAVLNGLAAKNSQKLDWKHSIVDMMKLLDMDSSLSARKELASELHYSGDTNDSAAMNVWLHKQVMQKLAENGGKVPDELKH
ncbi:MAG: DUF3597 domain-containing protein [Methylobacteriaceae bacterium]|nr:DUF3597 domain-containing protein [Methylobacteriaceae bacterium]